MHDSKRFQFAFFFILLIQASFWFYTQNILPDMEVIENPPSERATQAFSLGDEEFYFRVLALDLQNAGDGYGRFTPLKNYDYEIVQKWFFALDKLNNKSNFTPSIAAYYFGLTQYTPDVRYIVDYLDQNYDIDPEHKWWWLSQAIYLANHRLKDKDLALKLSYKLAKNPAPEMPMWAKQMPAFILEQMGEEKESFIIIKSLLDNSTNLTKEEINFMTYFINERLEKFIKENKIKKVTPEQYMDKAINKPLSKLAPGEQIPGAHGTQDRSVHMVREDPSTGATPKLPSGVEFQNEV